MKKFFYLKEENKRYISLITLLTIILSTTCLNAGITGDSNRLLPITSIHESSDNIYNYTTFVVKTEYAGDYHIGFWLLPAQMRDDTFTKYSVFVNGQPAGKISPKEGNWQYSELDDNLYITLNAGLNYISVGVRAPEIPSVERIQVSENPEAVKIPSISYNNYLEDIMRGNRLTRDNFTNESPSHLQSANEGMVYDNVALLYTFYKKVWFEDESTIFITSTSQTPHFIDMMYCGTYKVSSVVPPVYPPIDMSDSDHVSDLPSVNIFVPATSEEMQGINYKGVSEILQGSTSQVATVTVNSIPKEGIYLIRLRTTEPDIQGSANILINGQYFYENVPMAWSKVDVTLSADGKEYASMTQSYMPDEDDPMIFIHRKKSDNIVGWNDNGPQQFLNLYNLNSREAYICQKYNVPTASISVNNAFSYNPTSKCSIITGIEAGSSISLPTNIRPEGSPKDIPSATDIIAANNDLKLPRSLRLEDNFSVSGDNKIKELLVYDCSGNCKAIRVIDSNVINLPIRELGINASGIYVVTVVTEANTISGKLWIK